MLRVGLKRTEVLSNIELSLYSSISPIPFSVKIGRYSNLPETIYSRNLSGENFIEFRFDRLNKNIYEITLVAFQEDTIVKDEPFDVSVIKKGYYICLLEENIGLESSLPIKIFRSESSICINWNTEEEISLEYYKLGENFMIGVDINKCLKSVVLTKLSKDDVYNIFGF